MERILIKESYDFDDLLLIPRLSDVNSREEVDLSINLKDILQLKIPVIASPMKGIVGTDLINKIAELGGVGLLHRFYKENETNEWKSDINLIKGSYNFGFAIGLQEKEERILYGLDSGAKIICIDVANGYLGSVREAVSNLRNFIDKYNYKCLLMAGNVVTVSGSWTLINRGADLIRVGIGSGQLCTTRKYTGVGVPQLSALLECSGRMYKYRKSNNSFLLADGGIRHSGDAVKALACGADLLVLGSMLGKAYESAHNGIIYGMASRMLQEEYYHGVKSVEGIEKIQEKTQSLEEIISELIWGIKSAFTYLDANTTEDLRKNASFVRISK